MVGVLPKGIVAPPAIIMWPWVGVVTAAGRTHFIGVGGRSFSHFISDELLVQLNRVFTKIPWCSPPMISHEQLPNHGIGVGMGSGTFNIIMSTHCRYERSTQYHHDLLHKSSGDGAPVLHDSSQFHNGILN